jgi:hypothetical protein
MNAQTLADSVISNDFDFANLENTLTQGIIAIMLAMHNGDGIPTESDIYEDIHDWRVLKSLLASYQEIHLDNDFIVDYESFDIIYSKEWKKNFAKEMARANPDSSIEEVNDYTERNYCTGLDDIGDFVIDKNIIIRLARLTGYRDAKRCQMMQRHHEARS